MFGLPISDEELMEKTNKLIAAIKYELNKDPNNALLKFQLEEIEQMKHDAIVRDKIFDLMMKDKSPPIYYNRDDKNDSKK